MCDVCAAIKDARERTLNSNVRRWLTDVMEKHVKLQKYFFPNILSSGNTLTSHVEPNGKSMQSTGRRQKKIHRSIFRSLWMEWTRTKQIFHILSPTQRFVGHMFGS